MERATKETEREEKRGKERKEREIILMRDSLVDCVGHVGRQQRPGGIKSWEVRLEANEALRGKHSGMAPARGLCAAVLLRETAQRCLTRD